MESKRKRTRTRRRKRERERERERAEDGHGAPWTADSAACGAGRVRRGLGLIRWPVMHDRRSAAAGAADRTPAAQRRSSCPQKSVADPSPWPCCCTQTPNLYPTPSTAPTPRSFAFCPSSSPLPSAAFFHRRVERFPIARRASILLNAAKIAGSLGNCREISVPTIGDYRA